MWVIFNKTTGVELDRVETVKQRNEIIKAYEAADWQMHTYSFRWED